MYVLVQGMHIIKVGNSDQIGIIIIILINTVAVVLVATTESNIIEDIEEA